MRKEPLWDAGLDPFAKDVYYRVRAYQPEHVPDSVILEYLTLALQRALVSDIWNVAPDIGVEEFDDFRKHYAGIIEENKRRAKT